MDLAEMTSAVFAQHVKTSFHVEMAPDQMVEMTLTAVSNKGSSLTVESFALYFLAPHDAPARQGTYRMTHEKLGEFELFVVPIRRDPQGIEFEAVFVRTRQSGGSQVD